MPGAPRPVLSSPRAVAHSSADLYKVSMELLHLTSNSPRRFGLMLGYRDS
jgi:hypothetical protein